MAGKILDDLHVFDAGKATWKELTSSAVGIRPLARVFHGYTTDGKYLYVNGGSNSGMLRHTAVPYVVL
jgi:hypothetical protein